MNLIVFFEHSKDILNIVGKYKNEYNADVYEIKTPSSVSFFDKYRSSKGKIVIDSIRCNLNLKSYENIILVSPLWYNKIPSPVVRFLEQQTGNINNISYFLYNGGKEDVPGEFNRMDKILNIRRDKSFFLTLYKDKINVRSYQ